MKPELRFENNKMRAADLGQEACVPDLLGELILQNNLEFRLDEEDEIYEGYGKRPNAYPYRQYNCYTRTLTETEVKIGVLENKYLKAVFLLEYGGRLWELWDKATGKNLLYTNDVLQFSNLAVRNAWFSGGVEWNIGVIGHNPFTTDPLYTAKLEDEQGTPILRMYEYERIRKVVYQMDFWLEEESRFLNCRMRIVNESEDVIPMYWWSNMAVPEYENGRVIVPAESAFTQVDGVVFKVDIPMVDGIDVTDYQKIKRSIDYFFDIPEEAPKYIANVDKDGYGLLQISTKRLRSRKLFSWGNQDASHRWQEFLTDQAGRYTEIQAGLGKTQYGCIPMAPHTAWEWMEQYGPVQMSESDMQKSHKEKSQILTERLCNENAIVNLDRKLQETKSMAKKRAELVLSGSGYGALKEEAKWTEHLEFKLGKEGLKKWQEFLKTSEFPIADPGKRPEEFLINAENVQVLETTMEKVNKNNWYAHYHLGLGYYVQGNYEAAKRALKDSLELEENAWALHALSCVYILQNEKKESIKCIKKGIQLQKEEVSYLKEGFKLLYLCEGYHEICEEYKQLEEGLKQVGKIKFYYLSALHKMGEDEKAYQILEENGGLMMEDIREGEDSIAQLWSELYQNLYGGKKEVPHKYNFRAY